MAERATSVAEVINNALFFFFTPVLHPGRYGEKEGAVTVGEALVRICRGFGVKRVRGLPIIESVCWFGSVGSRKKERERL